MNDYQNAPTVRARAALIVMVLGIALALLIEGLVAGSATQPATPSTTVTTLGTQGP